ncbi:hypothetical protein EZV62_020090 [Acer yangbiense]|uniref:SWIM-type domain-containing protein n=1 Tax=Acer yangbiense TaxID=1000413 RepID=A0A5C7HCX0_9ROSI|nr:hypothetical protein EZV62_020090 [Acer yangbiense]
MTNVQLVLNWGGEWKSDHGVYWYDGRRGRAFDFPRDANYDQLLDKVYRVIGIDRNHYRATLTTVAQTIRPSLPIEIIDDDDVALLLRRENVDPLVCISVEEIVDDRLDLKQSVRPESPHRPHHATQYDIHHTTDVPNTNAHLDDIQEGFTKNGTNGNSPHHHFGFQDTTENQNVFVRDVSEPQFDPISDRVPNRSDDQFVHVQRLVPPPCALYSMNSGEVAPRPVDMCIAVGELFESKKQLQSQLGRYSLKKGFQIRVMKSDTTRYQVRCIVEECNWRLRAVKVGNSDYFQIRRFDHEHTCSTEARFLLKRQASARDIGEHIKEKFRDHRLYKPKEIIQDLQTEFGISCNYHKGYRAKHIALDEVQGIPVESYRILPSYLYMLEQTNPGTITDLYTDSGNRFMYMFFCLKACIDGFLSSIRPVIAIDATFLRGPHPGVLFVAVCMDGNNQIFPLAFGVGDSETNEAWEWFLTRLHRAIGEVDDLVFISDRKNSIITGVEKVFPNSFHGACAVHLELNMLGRYGKNKVLRDIFRNAVKVYRVNQFDRWKLKSALTTKADVNIGVKDEKARYLRVYPITYYSFLVKDGDLDGIVDLTSKTCTCREFDIDEIPCAHALACIRVRRFSYVDYCSPYYSSAFLATAYSGEIHPVGHPPEWLVPEDIASIVVLPPVGRRLPGRPKKNRTPSFGEEVSQMTCTTCHRNGHNSHTCTYSRSSRPSTNTSGVGEASGSHNV